MAKVGVGFDALEDSNAKAIRQFRVCSIEFRIDRKKPMFREADRPQGFPRLRGEFEVLLGAHARVGG